MENIESRQIQAFKDAAQAMKNERYVRQTDVEGQREFLYALQDVARELSYHLNELRILDQSAMEAYVETTPTDMPGFQASAELILTVEIESRIQALWKESRG